jgi:hypothetical protein
MNGPNKLECYITLDFIDLTGTNTLFYWAQSQVMKKTVGCEYNPKGPYSQHFIFFITYEWAQKTRVLHYIRLYMLTRDKHTVLLGPITSYEENGGM